VARLPNIPKWQPHDFAFKSTASHKNPFEVRFAAAVKGPDGVEFDTLGFFDGGKTWKIRLAPWREGEWLLLTHSNDPPLDGHRVRFVCVPNDDPHAHGGLRVDEEHPHHFVFEDGSRYFLLGYECDWLWALDIARDRPRALDRFLDKLASFGFNHVLMNSYAHDCPWRRGRTAPDDYGPPPRYPWRGTNSRPDHSRFNLAYWRHYDRVVAAMARRGIVAHIFVKVYNKMVNWPERRSVLEGRFFRWLVARYAPFPNVVWDFSKEGQKEPDLGYKRHCLRTIRATDPYHRLLTVHDDDAAYNSNAYDGLVDFRTDQQHDDWHTVALRQRLLHSWPILNAEFGYEHGPGGPDDKTYGVVQSPEELARRAWEIAMAGAYTAYYYTYTAWDVIRPDDTPPGYSYFELLREFFEGTRYWELEPSDDLVDYGHCLARRGDEYVVWVPEAREFRLDLSQAEGRFVAEWFRPLGGTRRKTTITGGARLQLRPPWKRQPVALHLHRP